MSSSATTTQKIKYAGMGVFLIGIVSFILTLFVGEYVLTERITTTYIPKDAHSFFTDIHGKMFTSKHSFIQQLNKSFDDYNLEIVKSYSISDEEKNTLLQKVDDAGIFQSSHISETILGGSQESRFKREKLTAYTSWIIGRNDELGTIKSLLETKINELNTSIVYEKGMDKAKVKSTVFAVVKSSTTGLFFAYKSLFFILSFVFTVFGALIYIFPFRLEGLPGIKNNRVFQSSVTNGGTIGLSVMAFLIGFYVCLYWYPEYITEWVILVDPLSMALSGNPASQWFLYGFMYTVSMAVMGVRMMIKYRHNKYQLVRTLSILFFQSCFAFILPEILVRLNQPYFDFKNMWPLDYDFFDAWHIDMLTSNGGIGLFMFVWGITLFAVGVPVLTYFFGKRWYCSWVCGCGGLAETVGDPYRQLSDKSLNAWKLERISIHSVLVFSIIMTFGVLYTYITQQYELFGLSTQDIRQTYGFLIGSAFSGVVGTGFYPKFGSRVWCRFGCPLAAYLGLIQRFKSRFRITTNGTQCISCGNCSTYCEMGIDVRWYAQRGQDIVRSSCVGCGVCAAVCPRGVLKLENGTVELDVDYLEKESIS